MKLRSFMICSLVIALLASPAGLSLAASSQEDTEFAGGILVESVDAGLCLDEADLIWNEVERATTRSLYVGVRKQLSIQKPIVSASLFVGADRAVTMYVNGTKLSTARERLLTSLNANPGFVWLTSGLYDITDLVRKGENAFAARVMPDISGGQMLTVLLAQIVLQYEDGTVELVSTDSSWELSRNVSGTGWTTPADMGGDDKGAAFEQASIYEPGWERVIAFGVDDDGDVDYTKLTSLWKDGGTVSTLDASQESSMTGFVTADGTKLMLNGKEYRAIGVNMPDLHQSYNGTWHHISQIYGSATRAKEAMVEAIIDAYRSKVAFIRFFAAPGYPVDAEKLYFRDRDEYWRQMDEVFDLCRAHNIRLIPCLGVVSGWFYICGEPKQAILDPNSETYKATYNYVEEFVTRYKDDPVVLMWELENEAFLAADVNMQGRPGLGAGQFPAGSPYVKPTLTLEDSLTFDMTLQVYKEWTSIIKSLDPNHLVTSGDACVRDTSHSLRKYFPGQVWTLDSLDQHIANFIESQTEPLDVFSIHAYGPQPSTRWPGYLSTTDYYTSLVRAAHSKPAPVFIGELGNTGPSFGEDPEAAWTRAYIDAMEQEGVSLMALWVWHFPWQPENTLTGTSHPLLIDAMKEFNNKYAGL
ncbi:MAG: cellulase family glycosylhydrolase [Bacillota bacterium]